MRGAWILGCAVLVGCGGGAGRPAQPAAVVPVREGAIGVPAPADIADLPGVVAVGPVEGGVRVIEPGGPGAPEGKVVVAPGGTPGVVLEGGDGRSGGSGPVLLVNVGEAAAGSCASGGSWVQVGVDADADGTLTETEIAEARALCSTAPILLLRTTDPASTSSCTAGVTTVALGGDRDGDDDLADEEVALSFQACAPPVTSVSSLSLSTRVGASPHLTALGELFFACADDPRSLCRLVPVTEGGASALDADLDGDGIADLRAFAAGAAVRASAPDGTPDVLGSSAAGGAIVSLASNDEGDVFYSVEGDAIFRKYVRAWDATVEWQVGCAGARLAADDGVLFAACPDRSLWAYSLAGGSPLALAIAGLPSAPARQLAASGGWVYLANEAGIGRFPVGGGSYAPLVSGPVGAMAVARDGTLWFTDGAGSLRGRRPDGAVVASPIAVSDPRDLALRGGLLAARDGSGKVTLVDARDLAGE